jgi:hypothetical protein
VLLDFSHTFAVDPNFRVGYAQNWQLAVQTDLPGALQMTATYLGIKGTRGVQEYLPRPIRSVHESMPGMSRRLCVSHLRRQLDARGRQLQLRRRLRSGFTATLQYTYSKSIDNDAVLRGQGPVAATTTTATRTGITTGTASPTPQTPAIAQNWFNLSAERGLSPFDQRNSVNAQIQCATGVGSAADHCGTVGGEGC